MSSTRESGEYTAILPTGGSPSIERYELVERIGRGAHGEVYCARERAGGYVREVCIKRLISAVAQEQAMWLREEARLLAAIRHANVVSLLDVGEERDGTPFLVLELVRGADLRALCRELAAGPESNQMDGPGLLPDLVAAHVACAVLRGLAAVQRAIPGLVHRDVTPHNVLISEEGEIKLGDFGIARALDRARWTRPCIIKGKLGYISPEQFRDEALDVRSDLFSVGVMLYEMLTRHRPWGDTRGGDELRAIAVGRVVPMCVHRPRLSQALVRVVDRLIAHRPCERFANADEALRALAPFSAGDLGSLRLAALVRSRTKAWR